MCYTLDMIYKVGSSLEQFRKVAIYSKHFHNFLSLLNYSLMDLEICIFWILQTIGVGFTPVTFIFVFLFLFLNN